jgi:LysM repeat protein
MRDFDIIHKVEKGETLSYISQKYGIPVGVIMRDNGISGDLYEGQRLVIAARKGIIYTVKPEDTAESIAAKFKVDTDKLLKENNTEIIYPYMNINIPE